MCVLECNTGLFLFGAGDQDQERVKRNQDGAGSRGRAEPANHDHDGREIQSSPRNKVGDISKSMSDYPESQVEPPFKVMLFY